MKKSKIISKAISLLIAFAFTTTAYVPLAASGDDLSAEEKAYEKSMAQATEEAKEDEEHHKKVQYEGIPRCKFSYPKPSISLTKNTPDNNRMKNELETEYENAYKMCKQNWGLAHKYDGLPYNEFHKRVQEDIRDNYAEINEKELYLVFSDKKTVELSRNVQSENTQNLGEAGVRRHDEPTRLKFLVPQVGGHLH